MNSNDFNSLRNTDKDVLATKVGFVCASVDEVLALLNDGHKREARKSFKTLKQDAQRLRLSFLLAAKEQGAEQDIRDFGCTWGICALCEALTSLVHEGKYMSARNAVHTLSLAVGARLED